MTTTGHEGGGAARAGWRRRGGWALAALVLASCLLFAHPADIAAALARLSPPELAVLVMVATATRLLMGLKWGLLLRLAGVRLPPGRAVRYFYQGAFAGSFMPVPVGGDMLRAFWASREAGARTDSVLASLAAERLLGLISSVNLALLGGSLLAVWVAGEHAWVLVALALPATVAADVALGLWLAPRVRALARRHLGRLRRAPPFDLLARLGRAFVRVGGHPRGLLAGLALTALEHGLQILLMYAAARSLDVGAAPSAFAAAAAVQLFLTHLPITPDGLGVSELGAIGVLGLAGVPPAEAVSLSLVCRAVTLLALAPGGLLMLASRARRPAPPPLVRSDLPA